MTAIDVRPSPDAEAVAAAVAAALTTIDRNIATFGTNYPGDTTTGGNYLDRGGNFGWTTSFWPGMTWLAHELTGDASYARAAAGHVPSFADRIHSLSDVDTHDLGFLYTLSCVVPWQLAEDTVARDAAVAAADHLLTRVLEPAGIIQAWGDMSDPRQQGRTIIDSLMNTPLLFWASSITGESRYADIARRHTEQLRDNILRPDGTTFHTFYWDPAGGEPVRGETEQGSSDESCWARGQAWGIYGFALNHRHTGDPSFRAAAERCAERFLDRLPADSVPYWDLVFGDGSGQERDSSAAAIAVCGLLTLGGDRYRAAAGRILTSLIDDYSTAGKPDSNALLRHGVYDKPKGVGVDEGNLWGDYFYLEALTRVTRPDWSDHW
ncbi:glycoside hydrolase family 88 protein [Actinoplanes sp. NPDC026619]|uniref:glycoside hydrolase family 88 protein n=1 Tax=Actinoplanes sp. NPDC026619 TaxID=3155798 RepID=UPI0034077234